MLLTRATARLRETFDTARISFGQQIKP